MPKPGDFTGKVNYDRMKIMGSFKTSSETINQIYRNAMWGIKGNYRSFPTDCPQRDERMPWLGDRATGCFGESFMFDHTLLYQKWLRDIEGSQKASGSLPDVAPAYWPFYSDNITWPSVFIHVANMLYEQRGDVRSVQQHYDAMKHWLDHMEANYLKEGIMIKDVYGDWCMPPESPELIHSQDPARKTDGTLLATGFYYRLLHIMSKFAVISNRPEDATVFQEQAEKVKKAYNERFFKKEKGWYGNNTVTANLVSLMQGLVPEEYQEQVFMNTAKKIETVHDSHVGVGLIGIQFLMRGLDAYGRSNLSLEIANQRTYPSWGYMIENGATTIWELWNGNTADPAMNSRNHVMLLGDFLIWCYENLAGIRTDQEAVGFKKIVMRPYFHEGLDFVKAHTTSPYGRISSSWTRTENGLHWKIGIPPNTSALVTVPAASPNQILVNKGAPGKQEGVAIEQHGKQGLTLHIPSGNYEIEVNKGAGATN